MNRSSPGSMKLSVVIPAFNEEKLLGGCLASVRDALAACAGPGLQAEVIVCDNGSTDSTARVAAQAGTRLVFEPVRRISRARNAGAAAATGDWLLFIDADSTLSAGTLGAMLDAARSGLYSGGGALIDLEPKPWWGALLVAAWTAFSRTAGLAAGSFLFCRADAFRETGGFPADMAAGEELGLSLALKRWGRARGLGFVILTRVRHVSSGRKFYLYTPGELWGVLLAMVRAPRRSFKDAAIHRQLYDGRR